jgi:hypothetical protein
MKLSASIIPYVVVMLVIPHSCSACEPMPNPAPRPAPVLLSSQDAVKTVRDVTQQLRQQSNAINAAQLSNPVAPTVITVNFDPVGNAQSQEAAPFFEQPFDPAAAQNFGLTLLGLPAHP